MNSLPLVLASSSPRRLDLMREAGLEFEVVAAQVEEEHDERAPLDILTRANAVLKASWVADHRPDQWVIGADTLVAINGKALGKPADLPEARRMIRLLAGRTHEVVTAVCLIHKNRDLRHEFLETTRVTFLPLTPEEIDNYLQLINPLDKAGAYAAQEHGEKIIAKTEGSMTNVIGLPMERLLEELKRAGALE
ncbi:MAG: Maf family protein [Verrucomicrobiota bacterium]